MTNNVPKHIAFMDNTYKTPIFNYLEVYSNKFQRANVKAWQAAEGKSFPLGKTFPQKHCTNLTSDEQIIFFKTEPFWVRFK